MGGPEHHGRGGLEAVAVTGSGIVFGDIGGYEQGGDYPWASYSAYYSASILKLFIQAQQA